MNHRSDEWPGVCHGAFHPRADRVRRIKRVIHNSFQCCRPGRVGVGGGGMLMLFQLQSCCYSRYIFMGVYRGFLISENVE